MDHLLNEECFLLMVDITFEMSFEDHHQEAFEGNDIRLGLLRVGICLGRVVQWGCLCKRKGRVVLFFWVSFWIGRCCW